VLGGRVGGTEIVVVGGGRGASVVVVVGGGSVVGVVVATGGDVVAGALVPTLRGAVVTTPACVVTEPPGGMVATVVVLESTVDDVEVGAFDVVGAPEVVEVGRAVVGVGDWVATCSLGDVSLPVATSKSMAASAMVART
jgi:hypothetical protein